MDYDDTDTVHLLGMSDVRMQRDMRILSDQKQNLAKILQAAVHDHHAIPLVALIDGKKIVEYNAKVDIPKDWIIDPQTGAVDVKRLPEKTFETPYRDTGLIDYQRFEERADAAGLKGDAYDREFELHHAHNIVAHSEALYVTEKFQLLRDRNGQIQHNVRGSYDLPPIERGYVKGPKDEPAPAPATP